MTDSITVEELVSYGRFPHQKDLDDYLKDKDEIEWSLNVTGITEFRHQSINDLSGDKDNVYG